MSELRKSARGRQCQVRLPGVCNFNPETVVLAHLGGAGAALKHNDMFGAFCCFSCHQVIDGPSTAKFTKDDLKLAHFEGIQRTQQIWLNEGLISITNSKNSGRMVSNNKRVTNDLCDVGL